MYNDNSYFLWLLDRIDDGSGRTEEYEELLWYLYERDFTWIIDMDENRAAYGLDLRYEFDPGYFTGNKPCSVLEMMIALAYNWEHNITYDHHLGDRTPVWFWTMVENLGLLDVDEDPSFGYECEKIVDNWLRRRFRPDGFGSPFPLKRPMRDQRKIEIWLQVQDYVLENVKI